MGTRALLISVTTAFLFVCGCAWPWQQHHLPDGRHHSDVLDVIFKRRHYDVHAQAHHDPVMSLARDLTVIEDDLRRDGTITVKKPDVWGDGNLIYFLQEFDAQLADRTTKFEENVQAYIARSDSSDLTAQMSLATSLAGKSNAAAPASTTPAATVAPIINANPTILSPSSNASAASSGSGSGGGGGGGASVPGLPDLAGVPGNPFDVLGAATKVVAPTKPGIGVEPTELARQHATFVDVCQALRRRHMGDDNSRAAGYGLYKFRIPVSVLPGRETNHGHSGVVTLRAQLNVDEANLRYTFPRLVIADLVDEAAPIIFAHWDDSASSVGTANLKKKPPTLSHLQPKYLAPPISGITALAKEKGTWYDEDYEFLRLHAKKHFSTFEGAKVKPDQQELRRFLFDYLQRVSLALEKRDAFALKDDGPGDSVPFIARAAQEILAGSAGEKFRTSWLNKFAPATESSPAPLKQITPSAFSQLPSAPPVELPEEPLAMAFDMPGVAPGNDDEETLKHVGWLLAIHAGILDLNLKRMLDELQIKSKVSAQDVAVAKTAYFFSQSDLPTTVPYWQLIIREGFPLSVFTLDAQVEEQNVYDAFSRRREMQLALAYSVAKGRLGTQQRIAYSRLLSLDQAEIALNRTVVGFSHGDDTFGWYFYPRVQSPPAESTNIGAIARTIWSTGPTDHYDLKHRKLEPGIRECEVLIAMPSFVTEVSFDVTTNWESLVHPGVTKRSYEEMVAQGGRIQQLKMCLGNIGSAGCYRPEDVRGLFSRVDQLERMLGLQNYIVNVPYEYEQSGTDLFDTGDAHLRPTLIDFYGLEYLQSDDKDNKGLTAYLFLTGRNFHPTQSNVVVGGVESHSLPFTPDLKGDVQVINRRLLRVKVTGLNKNLSDKTGFQVRVGTPAGMSNALKIPPGGPPDKPKGFSFGDPTKVQAALLDLCCATPQKFFFLNPFKVLTITTDLDDPLPLCMSGRFLVQLSGKKKDGTVVKFNGNASANSAYEIALVRNPLKQEWYVDPVELQSLIDRTLQIALPDLRKDSFTLSVTGYLAFDKFPVTKTLNTLDISVEPCDCPPGVGCAPIEPIPATKEVSPQNVVPEQPFGAEQPNSYRGLPAAPSPALAPAGGGAVAP